MSEHEVDHRLRSWAHSPGASEVPVELRRQILDIPATERSGGRRHRLRLLPGPKPTAGADDHGDQAQPIATNPNDGGTRFMFSSTKLFGIAASVALLSVLALAVPFTSQQQDTSAPAAQAPRMGEITSFTGEMEILGKDQIGNAAGLEQGSGRIDEQWTSRITTSDQRFSGLVTGFHSYYEADPGPGFVRVHTSRQFSADADGTWRSTGQGYQDPATGTVTWVTDSTGEGSYEGLSAMSICEQEGTSVTMACHGIIFEGEWPESSSDAPDAIPAPYLVSQ